MARFSPLGVEAVVKNLRGYLGDLDTMGGATQRTGSLLGTLGGAAVTAGVGIAALGAAAVAAAGAAAVGGLGLAIKTGIGEAIEAEKVVASLDATLNAVGDTTTQTRQGLLDNAMAYRDLAGGSDEAVLAAETVLLRFSNLRGEAFEPALQTTLDLAEALGTDAATAAGMLGRALEVPGEGLRALKAAGIVLTDQQKDMIDKMVEAGDTAGAQAFLMEALAGTIGGTAQKASETFGGQMTIMKNHILEATEGLGEKLLPVLGDFVDQFVKPAIGVLEDFLAVLGPELKDAFGDVLDALGETGGAFGELLAALGIEPDPKGIAGFIGNIIRLAADFIGGAGQVANWLKDTLPGALAEAQVFVQPLLDGIQDLFGAFQEDAPLAQAHVQSFLDFWQSSIAPVFQQVGENVKGIIVGLGFILSWLAEQWREHGDEILARVQFVFRLVSAVIAGALALVTGVISAAMSLIQGDWDGAWQAIKDSALAFVTGALGIVGQNIDTFVGTWRTNWELARTIVVAVFDRIKQAVLGAIQTLTAKLQAFAQKIADAIPDWLKPGSPTEFEMGIRGINQALQRTVTTVPATPMARPAAAAAAASGSSGRWGGPLIGTANIDTEVRYQQLLGHFRRAMAG